MGCLALRTYELANGGCLHRLLTGGGPELILCLLVTLILPEDRGLPVLYRPYVYLRRCPGAAAALGARRARIVDGQQQGSMVREVDRQPVEPMQDGEARVLLRAA